MAFWEFIVDEYLILHFVNSGRLEKKNYLQVRFTVTNLILLLPNAQYWDVQFFISIPTFTYVNVMGIYGSYKVHLRLIPVVRA